MPANIQSYDSAIKLKDFLSVENKTLIEKELFARIKPKVGSWASKVSRINVPAPYKTMTFRTVTYRLPPDIEKLVLKEGVVPDPVNGVIYSEYTTSVEPLGMWKSYTDEAATYSFDDVVRDNVDDLSNQFKGTIDNDIAKLYTKGTQVWQATTGLTREDIIKIRISLRKVAQSENAQVYAIMTPEDVSSLRLRYNKEGANLFQDLPANEDSVLNGKLFKFEGVIIEEDDNLALYPDNGATKRYAIFYVKDSKGRYPICGNSIDNIQFIQKPLGSSGTHDPLNQEGSMGVKMAAYGNMITAEECLARVEITIQSSDIATVKSGYNYTDGKVTVNGTVIANKNKDGTAATSVTSPNAMTVTATTTNLKISGTKTATLTIKDTLTGSALSGYTTRSSDTSKATVSGTTVTGVAAGEVLIYVEKEGYITGAIKFTVVA